MNYSTLTRRFAHPGIWGHETINDSNVREHNLYQQLWVTLSTMRKRDDQWVTVIGKAPKNPHCSINRRWHSSRPNSTCKYK